MMNDSNPFVYSSLWKVLSESQKPDRPEFSGTLLKRAGISSNQLKELELGRRSFTIDQLLMVASGFRIDAQSLVIAYLNEKMKVLSDSKQSDQQIEQVAENLKYFKSISFDVSVDYPDGLLKRFIKSIVFYEGSRTVRNHEIMLPDGVIQLIIALDDHERICVNGNNNSIRHLNKTVVMGAQARYRKFLIPPDEKTLTIRFKPGGFYSMTGIPASEITDSFIPAYQIFGPTFNDLRNDLKTIEKPHDCFKKLKQYLIKRCRKTGVSVKNGLNILSNISLKPVHQLAEESGISHKHLIHISKKYLGLSPKSYQRVLRFSKILNEINSLNSSPEWADIVYHFDYYDQPHLINEFREFSGFSPQSYIETGNTCSKYLHINFKR